MVDFSHLTDTEFEEFCYDLIVSINFTNMNWRKGTGKSTSPADNGRDIEADLVRINFDKSTQLEKYFFECKHYKEGVPPTAISNAITWAESERPNFLIIIASNFLSNSCKEYIRDYIHENKPKFQIRIWENKNIETFLLENTNLCIKWNLSLQSMNYHYINKYHLLYVTKPVLNTVEYLIKILDDYDKTILNEILQYAYMDFYIEKKIPSIKEYSKYKDIILKYKPELNEALFVHKMISESLAWAYHMGDIAGKQNTLNNIKDFLKFEENDAKDDDTKKGVIQLLTKTIEGMDAKYEKCNQYYNDFCDNVVSRLLEEPSKSESLELNLLQIDTRIISIKD